MRPPRLAAWLLSRMLPAADRDEVVGDLAEDFADRVASAGRASATRWYWRHAIRLAWTLGLNPANENAPQRSRVMSLDDVRYAFRRIAKQPAASIGSIVTLACAIGAGVAAWSLISGVLLHPLPIRDAEHIMVVGARSAADAAGRSAPLTNSHIYPLFPAVRASGVFQEVAAGGASSPLVTISGPPTRRRVFFATANFFDLLGVRLQSGRGFVDGDDQRGAPPVAILSDRFWRTAFEARRDIVGQTLRIGKATVSIVGVAPAGFRGLDLSEAPELYMPFHVVADVSSGGTNWLADTNTGMSPTAWVRIYGRLKPGVSADETVAGLALLPPGRGVDGRAFGLTDVNTASLAEAARPKMKEFARLLGVTAGLLLLTGCLTVGMLLLLRTEARRDEFAMCLAMGASRARLAAGVVVEGAMLAAVGAAFSVPVSWWLLSSLRTFQLPGDISMDLLEIPVDTRTLIVALAAAMLATFAMALVAGVFGLSADVAQALRARAGATPRLGRRRTRAVLVVAEIAIAMVLLSGAGLFVRSLAAALSLNPGYETNRIASATVSLAAADYTPERVDVFFGDLRERLSHNGDIRAVSVVKDQGGMSTSGKLVIDGEARAVPSFVPFTGIDEAYFPAMGLSMTRGRNFTRRDVTGATPVAIVSESLGRWVAKGGDPIGHHIRNFFSRKGAPPDEFEIIGVVPDVIVSVRALQPLALYQPSAQTGASQSRMLLIRAAGSTSAAVREATRALREAVPSQVPPTFTTIDERLSQQMGPQRFGATVLGALGGIAAVLTLFGVYVLAESMTALRRREMGVRAALGATRPQLSRLILAETARLVVLGVMTGGVLAWFGAGLIRTFLFRVEPFDVATIGTIVSGVLLLALGVSLRPAFRAGRVDLARVLREE